jgi:hypothetical protein
MAIENVFIGVASMPSRVDALRQVVEALLPQCAQLGVYLNNYKSVPDFLNDPRILVARSQDHGDLRDNGKFFFLDKTDLKYYASVDDDIHYPNDYIAKLIKNLKVTGGTGAVAVHGYLLPEKVTSITSNRYVFHFGETATFLTPANVVGTGTALINQHKWKLKFSEFGEPGMSDIWFALAAKKRDAPLWVIPRAMKWMSAIDADEVIQPTKGARSLYDEFKDRDSRQIELLKDAKIQGSWEFLFAQLFSVDVIKKYFSLTQAMQISYIFDQLRWSRPSTIEASPVRKIVEDKNKTILKQANAVLKARLAKRWVDRYSTLSVDFSFGDLTDSKTVEFVKQLPALVAGVDDSALPNNFKWDARPDRQQQLKTFIAKKFRDNAEKTATLETLDASSLIYSDYSFEDLISMAAAGSKSDFLGHPELARLASANPSSALELVYRYLNALPKLTEQDIPTLEKWTELFAALGATPKAQVVYAYLLSKAGNLAGASQVARKISTARGFDFELMMLGTRLAMLSGNPVTPVVQALTNLEEQLGYAGALPNNKKEPKVSVILTSYNQAESLQSTIDNVLASNYSNLELIVVDDCSTDASQDVLARVTDPRVRKVILPENGGPYMARNAALKVAKGDLIAFHDCGDYASPNRIRIQVEALLAEPDVKAVRTRHLRLTEEGVPILENNAQFAGEAPVTMLVRREVFKKVGVFLPTRTRGDVELLRRLQAVFGDDCTSLVNFPFYTAAAPNNSVSLEHETVRKFLRQCGVWHAAIKENPSIFDNWKIDGLLPFEIPAELSPDSVTAASR